MPMERRLKQTPLTKREIYDIVYNDKVNNPP